MRGGSHIEPSDEELSSCLANQLPGSPDYGILSFKNGFHGTMLGALSTTRNMSRIAKIQRKIAKEMEFNLILNVGKMQKVICKRVCEEKEVERNMCEL